MPDCNNFNNCNGVRIIPIIILIVLLVTIGPLIIYFFATTIHDYHNQKVISVPCTSKYISTYVPPPIYCAKNCPPRPPPIRMCEYTAIYNNATFISTDDCVYSNGNCYLYFNENNNLQLNPSEDNARFLQYEHPIYLYISCILFGLYCLFILFTCYFIYTQYKIGHYSTNIEMITPV